MCESIHPKYVEQRLENNERPKTPEYIPRSAPSSDLKLATSSSTYFPTDSPLASDGTDPSSVGNYLYSTYPNAVNVDTQGTYISPSDSGHFANPPVLAPAYCQSPANGHQFQRWCRTVVNHQRPLFRGHNLSTTPSSALSQRHLPYSNTAASSVDLINPIYPIIRLSPIQSNLYHQFARLGIQREPWLPSRRAAHKGQRPVKETQGHSQSTSETGAPVSPVATTPYQGDQICALSQLAQGVDYFGHARCGLQHSIVDMAACPDHTKTVSPEILAKVNAGSSIPPAVPSLFTGPTLDEALEHSLYNPTNTTNVYIRGLPPDTTDESLLEMCERFGEISSSKAIVDPQTGTCKGFGFACFESESDAQICIAGLIHCGYQVSFAKESFSARLKSLQDPQSTNLYVSNLPLDMHEKDLENLFHPHKILSNRILRDANNTSRGVGFARMDDRETADAIIAKFDNQTIGDDESSPPLQVRYADSPNQKRLKGQTQRRRQWRAREYNILTGRCGPEDIYGFGLPNAHDGSSMMLINPMAWSYGPITQQGMPYTPQVVHNYLPRPGNSSKEAAARREHAGPLSLGDSGASVPSLKRLVESKMCD